MKRYPFLFPIFAATVGLLLATGCDSTGLSPTEEKGTVELRLAGASSTKTLTYSSSADSSTIKKALVTISELSIVPVADTSKGDSTETGITTLRNKNFEVDLVDLQTGLDTTLAKLDIPKGTYSQVRLVTADKASVTFQDGSQRDVMIASGQQTGLKVNFSPFTIEADDRVEVTLHWDVSESLKGNARGQFVITPVIQATVDTSGTGS